MTRVAYPKDDVRCHQEHLSQRITRDKSSWMRDKLWSTGEGKGNHSPLPKRMDLHNQDWPCRLEDPHRATGEPQRASTASSEAYDATRLRPKGSPDGALPRGKRGGHRHFHPTRTIRRVNRRQSRKIDILELEWTGMGHFLVLWTKKNIRGKKEQPSL